MLLVCAVSPGWAEHKGLPGWGQPHCLSLCQAPLTPRPTPPGPFIRTKRPWAWRGTFLQARPKGPWKGWGRARPRCRQWESWDGWGKGLCSSQSSGLGVKGIPGVVEGAEGVRPGMSGAEQSRGGQLAGSSPQSCCLQCGQSCPCSGTSMCHHSRLLPQRWVALGCPLLRDHIQQSWTPCK